MVRKKPASDLKMKIYYESLSRGKIYIGKKKKEKANIVIPIEYIYIYIYIYTYIYIYIYIYKHDLALNNLHELICHKT